MSETMEGASYDSLKGSGQGMYRMRWLKIDSGTTIARGALLAGGWDGSGTHVHLATSVDTTGSELFIAAKDVNEKEERVTGYGSGVFNRSAIKLNEGLKLEDFELEMRRQDLLLTEEI